MKTLKKELRAADPRWNQFGAQIHRYNIRKSKAADQIAEFERSTKLNLPHDFKEYLRAGGNGGLGPYYGISLLQEWSQPQLEKDYSKLSMPFPADRLDAIGIGEVSEDPKLPAGCIRICNAGCEHYFVLVVAGKFSGTVWKDGLVDGEGLIPLCKQGGSPITFGDFIETWRNAVIKKEDHVMYTWVRNTTGLDSDGQPAVAYDMYPNHVFPKIMADTSPKGICTIAADQLPCPSCYHALRQYFRDGFRFICPDDSTHQNPKMAAINAAKNKIPIKPRAPFEPPSIWKSVFG